MAKYLRYKKKTAFQTLTSLIEENTVHPRYYGPLVSELCQGKDVTSGAELCVRLDTNGSVCELTTQLVNIGVLEYSIEYTPSIAGTSASRRLSINIADVSMTLNVEAAGKTYAFCDFTLDNIEMCVKKNPRNEAKLWFSHLQNDPAKQMAGLTFYEQCLADIREKRLVPMRSDEFLQLTSKSTLPQRHTFIMLLARAFEYQAKGWRLHPSVTGKEIEYTLYRPPQEGPCETCAICMEPLIEGQDTSNKEVPAAAPRPIDRIHQRNVDNNARERKFQKKFSRNGVVEADDVYYTTNMTPLKLVCGHSYHLKCLTHLMLGSGPISYRCPLCQKVILFSGEHSESPEVEAGLQQPERRGVIAPIMPIGVMGADFEEDDLDDDEDDEDEEDDEEDE